MKNSVRQTAVLWEEWRWAADQVWNAWDDLLATKDDGLEPHLRYHLALDEEHRAAHRLAAALGA
jgi:hypothetical protein